MEYFKLAKGLKRRLDSSSSDDDSETEDVKCKKLQKILEGKYTYMLEEEDWDRIKRRQMKEEMSDNTQETPSVADFPDVPLIRIFSFLNARERFKVGSVCRRWYHISRSSTLWKHLDAQNLPTRQFFKLLSSVPKSVTHLTLSCKYGRSDLRGLLTEVLATLRKNCDSLRVLTLSNVRFSSYSKYLRVNFPGPAQKTEGSYLDYYTKETNKEKYVFMPELLVLSLWKSFFCLHDFVSFVDESLLPKIEAMDFTDCVIHKDEYLVCLSRFSNLKEIYIANTLIRNKQIKALLETANGLRVLDLEIEFKGVEKLFPALRQHGQSLEKLYLGQRCIRDVDLSHLFLADKSSFPHLEELCVRGTQLTDRGIEMILNSCHSLRRVDVTLCHVSRDWLRYSNERNSGKVIFEENAAPITCCNHFKRNHLPQIPT